MFILDSLMVSGLRWVMNTVVTAAEAEMNDDTALREQLLEAEMRREMGEISDEAFAELEADLLVRIREIKERREGSSGPLALGGARPMETTGDHRFHVEADVSGDFHEVADAPHTTVIESEPGHVETITIADMDSDRSSRSSRSSRSNRSTESSRTARATRTTRTTRTK
jgi:hypothetical protein